MLLVLDMGLTHLLERNLLTDPLLRLGIRHLLVHRLRERCPSLAEAVIELSRPTRYLPAP